jgi:hypothetical protein
VTASRVNLATILADMTHLKLDCKLTSCQGPLQHHPCLLFHDVLWNIAVLLWKDTIIGIGIHAQVNVYPMQFSLLDNELTFCRACGELSVAAGLVSFACALVRRQSTKNRFKNKPLMKSRKLQQFSFHLLKEGWSTVATGIDMPKKEKKDRRTLD